MMFAEEVCQARKWHGLWLHCLEQNREAVGFYEKLGYQVLGKDSFEILPNLQRFDVVMVKKIWTQEAFRSG